MIALAGDHVAVALKEELKNYWMRWDWNIRISARIRLNG